MSKRQNGVKYLKIKPILSNDDNMYKIAAWVRDGTSGIGTVTYIDPKDNTFGALGHGITDIDTGKMPAGEGTILSSSITGINKRKRARRRVKAYSTHRQKWGLSPKTTTTAFSAHFGKNQVQMRPMEVVSFPNNARGGIYIIKY